VVVDKPINLQPGELRCPSCFGKDIVPSMPRGWRDSLMRVFGWIPRHCRFCERRFYIQAPGHQVESVDRHD
jgi:hypothetical protein